MVWLKRARPLVIGAVAAGVLLGGTACTRVNDFQSLHQYTPAEGVTADIVPTVEQGVTPVPIKVRNLLVVQTPGGENLLAGMVTTPIDTSVESIEGRVLDPTGKPTGTLSVDGDLSLDAEEQGFFEEEGFTVESDSDLQPGLLVELTIRFTDAPPTTLQVPVVDGSKSIYEGFPTATPSAPIEVSNS